MKQIIESIVKELVDYPREINVTEVNGEQITAFELRVAQSDLGKVIGKRGKTVKAIRTILNTIAARIGKRAILEIIE